ncbi:MAG: hypothetical protein GY696_31915, partial [Gammaproteobacteria bacterium]|nr:hypothetical protein [Gammaproteobacteria bacterium]
KVADALSRLVQKAEKLGVEPPQDGQYVQAIQYKALKEESQNDECLLQIMDYMEKRWPNLKKMDHITRFYYKLRGNLSVKEGVLWRDDGRLVAPKSMCREILEQMHKGHPGIVRLKWKLRESYGWPGMSTQAGKFVQNCVACQISSKSTPKDNIPIYEIPSPTKPWEQLAIDISGPYFNDNYIVVLIDYYSKYPEILSTKTITSTYIINWLREIFARYRNPGAIVSDNGPSSSAGNSLTS